MCHKSAVFLYKFCKTQFKKGTSLEALYRWRRIVSTCSRRGCTSCVVMSFDKANVLMGIENVNLAHNHPPLDVPSATSMLLLMCNAS